MMEVLTAVLTYHVTPGEVDPRRVFIPRQVSTLQGQTVFFNRSKDGPQVNQSNIACQGVQTTNGLVWIIDSVLQPQFFHLTGDKRAGRSTLKSPRHIAHPELAGNRSAET